MTREDFAQEEKPDDDYLEYGIPEITLVADSDASTKPWYEKNHIIGIGSSAESLLSNQMKHNQTSFANSHEHT